METMLVGFGAGLFAFLWALVSLLGVRGTCAGSCERLGHPACEGCPRAADRRGHDDLVEREKERSDVSAW